MKKLWLFVLLGAYWPLLAQGGWVLPSPLFSSLEQRGAASLDNGLVIGSSNINQAQFELARLDASGQTMWQVQRPYTQSNLQYVFEDVVALSNGDFVALFSSYAQGSGQSWQPASNQGVELIKFNALGQWQWTERHSNLNLGLHYWGQMSSPSLKLLACSDGGFLITGGKRNSASNQRQALKTNAQGQAQWLLDFPRPTNQIENYTLEDVFEKNNGDYLILGYYDAANANDQDTILAWNVSANGLSQNTQALGTRASIARLKAAKAPNGDWYLSINTWASNNNNRSIQKYNSSNNNLWSKIGPNDCPIEPQSILVNQQGHCLVAGRAGQENSLALFDGSNGQIRWQENYQNPYFPFVINGFHQVIQRPNGRLYAMQGDTLAVIFSLDSLGGLYENRLSGRVYLDQNNNCNFNQGSDNPLGNTLLEIRETNSNQTWFALTDAQGFYDIALPLGLFELSVPQFTNLPSVQVCAGQNQVSISQSASMVFHNLGFSALVNCPVLAVELHLPWLRRCFPSNLVLWYRNEGTQTASNSYLDLELDPNLHFIRIISPQNLSATALGNNVYRIQLGNLAIGQHGAIYLEVTDSCNTVLNDVVCNRARIYPDSSCWSSYQGPIISTEASCLGDSLEFKIRNQGGDMFNSLEYLVIEDNVMLRQGNFQLNTGGEQSVWVATQAGSVYRIEAQQDSLFPPYLGDNIAWTNALACGDTSSQGVWNSSILAYQNNYGQASLSQHCALVRGSYDPNDKQAAQLGYGPEHDILPNTSLDYTIRFQNTGTDTAFFVVIVDTLAAELNPATIILGPASHAYTWEIVEGNVLVFRFIPIVLPDSTTNLEASQGFVSFKIRHKEGLPLGTRIENQAAIYFDFNEPIFTNTTWHTLNRNFIVLSSVETLASETNFRYYPNPMRHQVRFELGVWGSEGLVHLEVFDLQGRLLEREEFVGPVFDWQPKQLGSGWYAFRVSDARGLPLAWGKLQYLKD